MPGRGNHSNPLGKLQDEVLNTLKLMFKSVSQHSLPLGLETDFTEYLTELDAQAVTVPIEHTVPRISQDPIRQLANQASLRAVPLIQNAQLSAELPCQIQPVLCQSPTLQQTPVLLRSVYFTNVVTALQRQWPIQPLRSQLRILALQTIPQPQARQVKTVQAFTAQRRAQPILLPAARLKSSPRPFALPITKTAVLPHRFSPAVREKFRQVLAEKAKTHPANIQLKMIFPQMNMGLYDTIQKDELGNLLCSPKNELLGRNQASRAGQAMLQQLASSVYLILGVRLDDKTDLRALLPTHIIRALQDAETSSDGGDAPSC